MQTLYKQIHEELAEYTNINRLKNFNRNFIHLLKKYWDEAKYFGSLYIDKEVKGHDGNKEIRKVLDFNKITELMDKTGLCYHYFDEDKQEFIMLPSKEFLLLFIVALELQEHTDEILAAAGYSTYMKNLNEFIIFVGLKSNISFDLIRDKLIDYGYRGEKAIDNELYYDRSRSDGAQGFQKILAEYCDKKGISAKELVKETGFFSVKWDVEKNRYYYEAFTGRGNAPFHLTNEQALRLFQALGLTRQEQQEFALKLSEAHLLIEDEERYLFDLIKEGVIDFLRKPTKYTSIQELKANDVSIHTKYINKSIDIIKWSELDNFVQRNFSNIRSFALFFEDVVEYEGIGLNEFSKQYGLASSALYDYRGGYSVPDISRLTVLVSLMGKMNEYIYFTLLKKAGKFEFGDKSDSPLIMVMQVLLQHKKGNDILFGNLFDILETILEEEDNVSILYVELWNAYLYQCEAITRHLLDLNNKSFLSSQTRETLNSYSKQAQKQMNKYILLSKILQKKQMNFDETERLRALLMNDYGFLERSHLIESISGHNDLQMEG